MKKYEEMIKLSPLLRGITKEEELEQLLTCVDGTVKRYRFGENIVTAGEELYFLGNLLLGVAQEQNVDGSICRMVDEGALLSEGWEQEKSWQAPRTILAKTDCTVLWVRWSRLHKLCHLACPFHEKALKNIEQL